MAVNGSLSSGTLGSPKSLGITLGAGVCPSGAITLNDIKQGGAYWRNTRLNATQSINVFLCDSQGNNRVFLFRVEIAKGEAALTPKTATIGAATGLMGKALYIVAEGDTSYITLINSTSVTVNTVYNNYSIAGVIGYGGSASLSHSEAAPGTTVTITMNPSAGYSSNTPVSSGITFTSAGANVWTFVMPARDVSLDISFTKITYSLNKASTPGGGTLSLSRDTATMGDEVTITATPAVGYQLTSLTTSPALAITNNKFVMPASNVTVTAVFEKINYTIAKAASPSAGGTVTTKKNNTNVNSANYGDSIAVTQTPADGYYFDGWTTSPANLISNNAFTMPAQNVSVTAKYLKRSTATVDKKDLTGGGTVKLTISPDKAAYSHKYKLSFGTNMETSLTSVAAGTTIVNIPVPAAWSNYLTNAATKSGGTLIVETYSGNTKIGTYTITGFTYTVQADAVPDVGTILTSIARTIGGVTYANIGDIYTQGKCGVRVQVNPSGVLSSTITKIEISLSGLYGTAYAATVNNTSADWTSGLLINAGTVTVTVKVTDSRGRTATETEEITVAAYMKPSGTLQVRRVDSEGNDDNLGQYARYAQTNSYTDIGTNSLTVKLKSQNVEESSPPAEGNLLPGQRQLFNRTTEYQIQLILQDAFETVTITTKLPTAQFFFFVSGDGEHVAIGKATNNALGKNGKLGTIELSGDMQTYVGTTMLEEYIKQQTRVIKVSKSSVSSLPTTITDSGITNKMECIKAVLSNPAAQRSDWTVTTSNGSLQISGTISGTTNITLYLDETA